MQNGPSQVTTGNISPTVFGPQKDRDVLIVSGLVVSLAAAIGAFWFYSSTESTISQDQLNGSQVSEVLKHTNAVAIPVSNPISNMAPAAPVAFHSDLYFEVGRKSLTDEAKKLLAEQAASLKHDANLGVLVQGYTDRQGSAGYNLKLGMKRAEAVKAELINAGVAQHQIKTVSLGKDGALCIDDSDVCRQMNRRVHLEIRKIGEEHMVAPVVATTSSEGPTEAMSESRQQIEDANPFVDNLLPSASASQPDEPGAAALEPASGS